MLRVRLLAFLLLAAKPAFALSFVSADRGFTLKAPLVWRSTVSAADVNSVLELRRRDGASISFDYAPFPAAEPGYHERVQAWAAGLKKRGHKGPLQTRKTASGTTLYFYPLELEDSVQVHGFFAAPFRAYYFRTSKLSPAELVQTLSGLETETAARRPFEALWPGVPLKTVLAENGAFVVQAPEPWKAGAGAELAPKQVLELLTGQSSLSLSRASHLAAADAAQLKESAETTRSAAVEEGAVAGPVQFVALPNGLSAYLVSLNWPKLKDGASQWGGFFAFEGQAYAVAAINFTLPALRELLGSLAPPPPEWKGEAAKRAAAWGRPETVKAPVLPAPPKRPSKPYRRPGALPFNLLLLVSAGLALAGAWLYIGESKAKPEAEEGAEEAAAADPAHPPAPEPPPPEAGPLSMRRHYLSTPSLYEFSGPEGLRFIAESKRPLWLLRWTCVFTWIAVWAWTRGLDIKPGPGLGLVMLVCAFTVIISLPAETLFGRRFRLYDRKHHLLLTASRGRPALSEEYAILDNHGRQVARLRRRLADRLFQKRWTVLTPSPEDHAVLIIEGDPEPVFRRIVGHLGGLLRDDLKLKYPTGELAGLSLRQGSPLDRALIEYPPETSTYISSDILALSLALIHTLDPDRPHPWFFA